MTETEDVHERRAGRAEIKRQGVLSRSHIKIMATSCAKAPSPLAEMAISSNSKWQSREAYEKLGNYVNAIMDILDKAQKELEK